MSEVEEIVAIFGVGDHVWVPWSTIVNSITIKVKTESKNPIKANKLVRYWPAFVLERHVTTKFRKVAYARIVPTSAPQNGNSLSPKYLVKLIGLNVNQVFYEKSLRSWLSFNPKPLPEISLTNDFNLSGQDISLSDITIEKLTALYVQSVQKVSNKLKPAFDPRDYNSEISKNVAQESTKVNSGNPVRLRIIYNKNSSKDSINNSSNFKAKKAVHTPIYNSVSVSSINANTHSSTINSGDRDNNKEKRSNDETYLLKKRAVDNIKRIPLNNFEKTSWTNPIAKKKISQVESDGITTILHDQQIVPAKEQECSENSEFSNNKLGIKKEKNAIVKLDTSNIFNTKSSNSIIKASTTTDDSSLLRRTRNGSVFGKWRASKRSRHVQENSDQDDSTLGQNNNNFISNEVLLNDDSEDISTQNVSSISTSKADAVQTKNPASKNRRNFILGTKKTRTRLSEQVNKDVVELQVNEVKRRKIQDDSYEENEIRGNYVDKMEIDSEPNDPIVQCNNTVKSMSKPRMELYKRKNEGKSKLITQNNTQILQRKVESGKIVKEGKIRNRSNYNTCALNVTVSDSVTQSPVDDNYMRISQQDDVDMKNEQDRIINMNSNNSLSSVFSSPLQSFRSVLGFGNIFSWSKRGIDI